MHRSIAKPIRNLGKVQLVAADKLLGCVNFHQRKKFHYPAPVIFLEKPLKLRAADQGISADFLYADLLINMLFHITDNPVIGFIWTPGRRTPGLVRDRKRIGKVAAVEMDN